MCMVFTFVLLGAQGQSVSGQPPQVSLHYSHQPLETIIDDITSSTGIRFYYSPGKVDLSKNTSIEVEDMPLPEVLDILFEESGIAYQWVHGSIVLTAQKKKKDLSLHGYIRDKQNGEGIIGASVYLRDIWKGTSTNTDGYYVLEVDTGRYVIHISCMGYNTVQDTIQITGVTEKNYLLGPSRISLEEAVITQNPAEERMLSVLNSYEKINIATIEKVPNLFGEPDIIRDMSFLAGISNNELSAGEIYIRGSSPNQTVFMMDGTLLSNVTHFGGFYSYFNPDVIKNVSIHKGIMPASMRGGLSGVVDVNLKEGNKKRWQSTGGIGLLSARLAVEGPLIKNKTSVVLAARRSYFAHVLNLMNSSGDRLNMFFNDFNLKLDHRGNNNNKFYVSTYFGNDKLLDESEISKNLWSSAAEWTHFFHTRLILKTQFNTSGNTYNIYDKEYPFLVEQHTSHANYHISSSLKWYMNSTFQLSAGYLGSLHQFKPFSVKPVDERSIFMEYKGTSSNLLENDVFIETNWHIGKQIIVNAGLRNRLITGKNPQTFEATGNTLQIIPHVGDSTKPVSSGAITYLLPEPRISIRLMTGSRSSVKLAYGHTSNAMHKLNLYNITISLNRIIPCNESFPPTRAKNLSLGYYYASENNNASFFTEVFYQSITDIALNRPNAEFIFGNNAALAMYSVDETSVGMESSLNLNIDPLHFVANYSFNDSRYQSSFLNNQKPFDPYFNSKHILTLLSGLRLGKRFNVELLWTFKSGLPYTAPAGKYEIDGHGFLHYPPQGINSKRLPAYHRMDFNLDFNPLKNKTRKWKQSWSFSVINVYARKNPLGVVYFDISDAGQYQEDKPRFVYFYQFVPTFAYKFSF